MTAVFALTAEELMERSKLYEQLSDHRVVTALCRSMGAYPDHIRGPHRDRHLVESRRVIAKQLRDKGWSLPRIGRALGGRDHSSIWWLLRGGRRRTSP